MPNPIQPPNLARLSDGMVARNQAWTSLGAPTTLYNTSSTWSVTNVCYNTSSGWFTFMGQESTPAFNIFTTYKANGFSYNQYNVNNSATANPPIAGIFHRSYELTFPSLGNNFVAASNGAIYRNGSIFTSTSWTLAVASNTIFVAGFASPQNEHERIEIGGRRLWAYGRDANNQGVVRQTPSATSTTMNAYSPLNRTDGQVYTAGASFINDFSYFHIILGTQNGNIIAHNQSLNQTTNWGTLPGSGPITSLYHRNGRLFWTRGTTGGQIYYADITTGPTGNTTADPGTYNTVTVASVGGANIGACMDTSTFNNYTAEWHFDKRNNAILMTGNKCSVWYSLDNGVTWAKSSLSDTLLGNSAFGYVRLVYNNGYDEWSGVVAGREDGNRTGSLLRNTFWCNNPIL